MPAAGPVFFAGAAATVTSVDGFCNFEPDAKALQAARDEFCGRDSSNLRRSAGSGPVHIVREVHENYLQLGATLTRARFTNWMDWIFEACF
jgi:hypothetical protein